MENLNIFILEIKEYDRLLTNKISRLENGITTQHESPFKPMFQPIIKMLWCFFALGDPYEKKELTHSRIKINRTYESLKIEVSLNADTLSKNSIIHKHILELKELSNNETYLKLTKASVYYQEFKSFENLISGCVSWYTQNIILNKSIPKIEENENLEFIDLKTQKEQIRLLYDLGVIDYLKEKYPNSIKVDNALASLLASILKVQQNSIYSSLSYLLKDDASNKNYPKETERTKSIINRLNANEQL